MGTGYVVLTPSSLVPVPLAGLVSALLFPDGRGAEVAYQVPGQRGTVTLLFQGSDQGTYRLLRELGGAGVLHRVELATGQMELITDDSLEMAQFLRQVGLPPRRTFDQAFTVTSLQFPTKRPKARQNAPSVHAAALPSLPTAQPVQAASDVHAARAKLFELMKELDLAQEIERIQFRLDEIASETSEVEAKLQEAAALQASVKEAEAAFASAPSPESMQLPNDITARAERFPQLVAKRDEALARLDLGSDPGFRMAHVEPLKANVRFWAAIAAGLVLFAAGIALKGAGHYLALLDIPAFGFAAVLALRYVDDLQKAQRSSRRGERAAAREKKIVDDFEAEAQSVKEAMAVLKVDKPSDIGAVFGQKAQLGQRLKELRARTETLQKDPAYVALKGKDQQLKKEQQVLEAKLTEKGGYLREAREIERDIDRIKRSIEAAAAPQPAPARPAEVAAPIASAPSSPPTFEDPFPGFLAIAADLLMTDPAGAMNLLRERLTQYFAALTDRRYAAIEVDGAGRATLQSGGGRVAAAELPPRDLDTLYLACRLTLIERCGGRNKIPVIIEDLLTIIDPAKVALLGRMLKQLGTISQVLHVTSNPEFPAMADTVVKV